MRVSRRGQRWARKVRTSALNRSGASTGLTWPTPDRTISREPGIAARSASAHVKRRAHVALAVQQERRHVDVRQDVPEDSGFRQGRRHHLAETPGSNRPRSRRRLLPDRAEPRWRRCRRWEGWRRIRPRKVRCLSRIARNRCFVRTAAGNEPGPAPAEAPARMSVFGSARRRRKRANAIASAERQAGQMRCSVNPNAPTKPDRHSWRSPTSPRMRSGAADDRPAPGASQAMTVKASDSVSSWSVQVPTLSPTKPCRSSSGGP